MIALKGDEYNIFLPARDDNTHKGDFGTLAIVAGSSCYQGAAYFATKAALHSGVGIVVSFIPDSIYNAFACKINGAVIEPLNSVSGCICDDDLTERILHRRSTAVLCGCGLGFNDNALKIVTDVLSLPLAVVIDGDGLSALSLNLSLLKREHPTVLTPHMGEFSRLCGMSIENIKAEREHILRDFCVKHNCFTVLKDSISLICTPTGEMYSLSYPCSALSKGGSGDVLAGMLSSFIAQGIPLLDSMVAAVTLHNTCGRMAAEQFGKRGCQPDDYISMLRTLKV